MNDIKVKAGDIAMIGQTRCAVLAIAGEEAMVRFAGDKHSTVVAALDLVPAPAAPVVATYAVDNNPLDLREFVEMTPEIRRAVSRYLP